MSALFFSSRGRMARRGFILGLCVIMAISLVGNILLRQFSGSITGFWVSLILPCLILYMLYCLCLKRLHDLGRTGWAFFGMIALEILVIIILILSFGGAEYFAEYAQFSRDEVIDPEIIQAINRRYQDKLAAHMPIIRTLMYGIPALFLIWLSVARGENKPNAYGPLPKRIEG